MADFYRLLEKKQNIWVTNQSGGKIILELRREGHKSKPFTAMIPPIKDHPMLLNSIIPYPILEYDHSTIFSWFQNRMLKLHKPAEAKAHYADDEDLKAAVEEMVDEANQKRSFASKDIGLSTADGANQRATTFTGKTDTDELNDAAREIGANAPVFASSEEGAVTLRLAAEQQRIHPKIAEIMASLSADGSNQSDAFIKLKTIDAELLTSDSLGFIIDHTAKHPPINKWARSKRAELTGSKKSKRTKKSRKNR